MCVFFKDNFNKIQIKTDKQMTKEVAGREIMNIFIIFSFVSICILSKLALSCSLVPKLAGMAKLI